MPTIYEMGLLNNSLDDLRESLMRRAMLKRQDQDRSQQSQLNEAMMGLRSQEMGLDRERLGLEKQKVDIAKQAKMTARWRNMKGVIREIEGGQDDISKALETDPPDPKSPVDLQVKPADTWGVGYEVDPDTGEMKPKSLTGKVPAETAQGIINPTPVPAPVQSQHATILAELERLKAAGYKEATVNEAMGTVQEKDWAIGGTSIDELIAKYKGASGGAPVKKWIRNAAGKLVPAP